MIIPKNFGLKISGIYKITNIVNNKFYIGSSNDIYHRLKHHYSDLKNNNHHNKYLLRSFQKYNKDNFKVEIIEIVEQSLLIEREQYYIDTLKPQYNLMLDVINNKLTESSKKQISETLKKQYLTGKLVVKNSTDIEEVIIYDFNCKCINKFKSRKKAAKFLLLLYPNFKLDRLEIKIRLLMRGYAKSTRSKLGVFKNHYILPSSKSCIIAKKLGPVRTIVESECILTNKIIQHDSITDCVKYFKSSKVTIYSRIKDQKLLYNQYKLKLIGDYARSKQK